MTAAAMRRARRRWLAPEVVQTSAMDCGPASLKCLLEGFGISVSYGRLREACQTDIDGTSIDTIEVVANQLGIRAEQEMLPIDHLFLDSAAAWPALIVVRHSDGPTHFVVVWRRLGSWLQVMDPAIGRRWVRCEAFLDEIFRHQLSVPADDWRNWAETEPALNLMRERLRRLGADRAESEALIAQAASDRLWFSFGALDASLRLVRLMVASGGVAQGREAVRLASALFTETCASTDDIFTAIPAEYWSVSPDPRAYDRSEMRLLLRGAVLMRVAGRAAAPDDRVSDGARPPLSPELVAALNEGAPNPLRVLWGLLRTDGLLGPLVLTGAIALAGGATLIEALLFRGIFEIGNHLTLPSQRLVAALALVAFAAILLAFQIPIMAESMRMGRRLDLRLRLALLRKLPHLTDRYFQSRPISDMADRGHGIHLSRLVPGIGIHAIQTFFELILTLLGILLIDPASLAPAIALAAVAIGVPALLQPMVNERDLRVRNHAGALNGFYLDTLLGLVPIRTHRAERAVRHQHEALLVEWARSSRRLIRASISADAIQSVGCVGLAGYLLIDHFMRAGGVTGADLLLVYWSLKLPAIGGNLTALAQQYPMQRNILLRLLEPLAAPEQAAVAASGQGHGAPLAPAMTRGVGVSIEAGGVLAAGRPILDDVDLTVAAGEHVGIVGLSGAGKSSLLGLLLGWHRLASGRIAVDGAELTPERLAELRHRIAWLDPAVQIWNKSFFENLTYSAPDADFADTAAAIDIAQLRGVLRKLPQGLQTPLGEGGALLSGGEGQRVRFARALAQTDVDLVLLDEPFRGMDRDQRSALLQQARRHWRDTTLLCVTHDVGETLAFDRVVVIEGGRIVEDGAPAELASRPSRYRKLLAAEQVVRDQMWAGENWRRIRVQNGDVVSCP